MKITSHSRLVLYCTCFLLLSSCDFFLPEYEPHNKILLSAYPENDRLPIQVFVVNPDGTVPVRISKNWLENAVFSPNGEHIAGGLYFATDGPYKLSIMGYKGDGFRTLKDADSDLFIMVSNGESVSWSPDSRSVLNWSTKIVSPGQILSGLRIVDIHSGETSFIEVDLDGPNDSAKWSPDGTTVLFTHRELDDSYRTVTSSLYLVNLDGEILGRVETDPDFFARDGLWARSGDRIFYLQYGEYPHAGTIMSIEIATGVTRVIQASHPEDDGRWWRLLSVSPDDRVLLVADDDWFLYQIDLDTNGLSKMHIPEFEGSNKGRPFSRIQWADWSQ